MTEKEAKTTEVQDSASKKEGKQQESQKKKSLSIYLSLLTAGITLLLIVWYVASDRHTPNTDQARVKGLLLPVAPMVNGYITKINVELHSQVKFGDTLLTIDSRPYEMTVDAAEAALKNAIQSVNAGSSTIKSATARVSRAKVNLERSTKNWERTQRVRAENKGALSEADIDRSEASYLNAIEQLTSAEADLKRQKDALGPLNEENPAILSAITSLEKAQYDLEYTAILATSDGIVESFNLEKGYFASAGKPLFTLVANKVIWVQANFKENNLSNAKLGDKVEIIFDIDPGKVYNGKLASIAYGVSTDQNNPGGLPQVSATQGWLRDPQRFPVIISIEDEEIKSKLRQGSQTEVVIYTRDKGLLNALARFRIRLLSKLSYVR